LQNSRGRISRRSGEQLIADRERLIVMRFAKCTPALDHLDPGIARSKHLEFLSMALRLADFPRTKGQLDEGADQIGIAPVELISARERVISIVVAAHA